MKNDKMSALDVLNLIDAADAPEAPKKRGRPPTGAKAKSAAARQRDLRNGYETAINETPSDTWTDAQCRAVLNGSQWRGKAIDEQAWLQLGKLRGFIKQ